MINNILALHQIRRDRRKTSSEIKGLQEKRLQRMLIYIGKNVPFYVNLFQKLNYKPEKDFAGINDLKILPVINKSTYRHEGVDNFLSKKYNKKKLVIDHSSGSTGEPFRVYRNKRFHAYQLANFFNCLIDNGYFFTDKILSFSSPARLNTGKTILSQFNLLRRLPIDYNLPTPETLKKVFEYRPDVIYGNPSSFDLLALEMQKQNKKIDFVKLLFAGGTSITKGSQELIYNRFGTYLTEFYGAIEFGILAYKKQYSENYFLCEDQVIYENLDNQDYDVEIGETGRLIITSLCSQAMPLLRYDIGDAAVFTKGEEKAEKNKIMLKEIYGRSNELAELIDGRMIAYQHFHSIMNTYTGIKQFKVIQKDKDFFEILLVAESDNYFKEKIVSINKKFDILFKGNTKYRIIKVEKLLNEKGGKIKTFEPLKKSN